MDAKPQNSPPSAEITALIARAAASRESLGASIRTLRHKADVPARIKDQLRAKPALYFGAAAGIGLIASRIFRSRRPTVAPEKKSRTLKGLLLTAAIAAAKPALKSFVIHEAKKRLLPLLTKAEIRPRQRRTDQT